MAGHAGRRTQTVVIVDVAIGAHARRIGVGIRQREADGAVIESRRLPCNRCVALLAILRKSSRHVAWIGGPLEVAQMAGDAGRAGQVVVVADVAIGADSRRVGVCVGQRKTDTGVIELGV